MNMSKSDSVYRVTELIGSSGKSWEEAAKVAIERASKSLRDLRVAEVVSADITIENGKIVSYRTKLKVSFKHEEPEAKSKKKK
jgi:dodecin